MSFPPPARRSLWRLDQSATHWCHLGSFRCSARCRRFGCYRRTACWRCWSTTIGTVSSRPTHLTPGDVDAAHRAYCGYNAGPTPVRRRNSGAPRHRRLHLAGGQPGGAACRGEIAATRRERSPSRSSWRRAGMPNWRTFPQGTYRLEYAVGELWSRACDTFAAGMRARRLETQFAIPGNEHFVVSDDNGYLADDIPDQAFERE